MRVEDEDVPFDGGPGKRPKLECETGPADQAPIRSELNRGRNKLTGAIEMKFKCDVG